MDGRLQIGILTCSLVVILLACSITSTISRQWITFNIYTRQTSAYYHDSYFKRWQITTEEKLDVKMGLWTLELCNQTSTSNSVTAEMFNGCSVDSVETVLDIIDVLQMNETYRNTWVEAVSIITTLRFASISANIMAFLGCVCLIIYQVTSRLHVLEMVCNAIWFYLTGCIMIISITCVTLSNRSLIKQTRHIIDNYQQQTSDQCRLQFHNAPNAVLLSGVSSIVAILLAVIFTVLCCRRRRQVVFTHETGLPEDLSDFGPVVSCEDSDNELQRFINKSNS